MCLHFLAPSWVYQLIKIYFPPDITNATVLFLLVGQSGAKIKGKIPVIPRPGL